jgi:hypothetical protein
MLLLVNLIRDLFFFSLFQKLVVMVNTVNNFFRWEKVRGSFAPIGSPCLENHKWLILRHNDVRFGHQKFGKKFFQTAKKYRKLEFYFSI